MSERLPSQLLLYRFGPAAEFQGLLVSGGGLVKLLLTQEDVAQVGPGKGLGMLVADFSREIYGLPAVLLGSLVLPEVMEHQA